MLERIGDVLTRFARRYVPDPFVLALLLTLAAFAMALVHVGLDGRRVLMAWFDGAGRGRGFWSLLAFGMQMCLILVTGHALASSPPVRRGLDAISDRASTPARAVFIVAACAMVLALVNWGLGLVAGALLARKVGIRARERGTRVHYPLLAAAGYSGLLVWHGGLSGSAPIKMTLEGDVRSVLGDDLARTVGTLPLDRTIGGAANLAASGALLVLVPWLLVRMMPPEEARVGAPDAVAEPPPPPEEMRATFAARLERSRALALAVSALGAATLYLVIRRQGLGRLDPNVLNFAFLFLGLALHGSARSYGRAVSEAARSCAGILLQFPFYAGIMGLLAGTGVVASLAGALADVGPRALPVVSFYSAGLVNLFVPSGGGQWAVQGPLLMEAAIRAGVEPSRLVMALAYGDEWTNMLQPFWALPLLGITRVPAREILGYTAVLLLASQVVFVGALYAG